MSLLKDFEFSKKLPIVPKAGRAKKSPLELAKIRLTKEIDVQIALANDPKFKVVNSKKQRGSGKTIKTERIPRSWVFSNGDTAYITPRFSNKILNVGGKKGANIKTTPAKVVDRLKTLKKWVESSESGAVLTKAIDNARRGRKKKG